MALAPAIGATNPAYALPPITDESRAISRRSEQFRIALMGEMSVQRDRYTEVMKWVNPPWDPISRRLDPRPEAATVERGGIPKIHVDVVGQAVNRWAVLEVGAPPICRVIPRFVAPPSAFEAEPERVALLRKTYDIDREAAQSQSTQMESVTKEWMDRNAFGRTMLWAAWAKNAFGVAVLRDGWDPIEEIPTVELLENPSQVYRAWSKRYGRRILNRVMLVDQMSSEEANFRFDLDLPLNDRGLLDIASWAGVIDQSPELDQRPEQMDTMQGYIYVQEYWELDRSRKLMVDDAGTIVSGPTLNALVIAGRAVEVNYYPWPRLPFHVLEDEHVATYMHSKSVAERTISINEAYDDLLDRQQEIIQFESGPRYKGLNMFNSGDVVDMPNPFELLPLREGEDIQQIETRVDFFPSQLHATELRDALYTESGLTPIAWGRTPNAQTSGRALSAEWRAVELPLTGKIINMSPEIVDVWHNWWDYAETYRADMRLIAHGYRRFEPIWEPLDIRDQSEKTLDVIQRLGANILDPEGAMQATGIENVDEVLARVRSYLLDPVWNPLRYQQYLILQQLEIQIQMQAMELQAAQAQQGQGQGQVPAPATPPGELAQQGVNAAGQAAQGPPGPVNEASNQPGAAPGGLPLQPGILSRTPLEGGVGNQIILGTGAQGPAPTAGQVPR